MNDEPSQGWLRVAREAEQETGNHRTLWLNDDVPLYFSRLRAGRFRIGQRGEYADEEPVTEVELPPDLWLATFPTTLHQFRASGITDVGEGPGNYHPVTEVSWNDAARYAQWINDTACPPGYMAVLPPEIVWEAACRAGTPTAYHHGDGTAALDQVGWYSANSGHRTHAVGKKQPNAWGLYDMHGNVLEWCADRWSTNHAGLASARVTCAPPVPVPENGPYRMVRGGAWGSSAWYCRAAYRDWWGPGYRLGNLGFRLLLAPVLVVQKSPEDREAVSARKPGGTPESEAQANRRASAVDLSKKFLNDPQN